MKTIDLNGKLRKTVGKTDAKNLRKEELVPCVIYGKGENIHFQVEEKAFKKIVYTPNAYIVNFDIEGKNFQGILRDVQYHPVSDRVIHADFYQIDDKSPVWMKVPVVLEGSSIGVLKGGRLVQKMRKLKVKALPGDLPDDIKIDISKLDVGKSIKIANLEMDKVELLDPANAVVVLVKTARTVVETVEGGEEGEESAAEGGEGTPAEGGEAAE